ncbi:MAG: ATP-dependent DNA ligase [Burkholderiaceae bacterium]|nr:ATP-dependent DNA ligase [Burkholderiaceae bacterium]
MKQFARLYQALDGTTSSRLKTELMAHYFSTANAADAAWAVYFLAGGKLKRLIPAQELRAYARQQTQMPDWLFEASYQSVGDLAETITLVLPPTTCTRHDSLHAWVTNVLLPLKNTPSQARLEYLHQALEGWDSDTRFICLKLVTGGFRVGVSRLLVTRALAQASELPATLVAQRLVGYLGGQAHPDAAQFRALINPNEQATLSLGQPYPFFLAQSVKGQAIDLQNALGDIGNWQLEFKYDGIRAQLVKRANQAWLWSRGEELINEQFPDLVQAADALPDGTVLDGEILVWHDQTEMPAPFADLQKRLGRKQVTSRVLTDFPAVFMAYDLLELDAQDCRQMSLVQRRELLQVLVSRLHSILLRLSPTQHVSSWDQALTLQQSAREARTEGLMLKALSSRYGIGRTREAGLWFKFKLEPLSIDAVLIYAQKGHGRRANLYTDYTFAVWHQPDASSPAVLVPVAKAYSGLTDEEFRQVDAIIKKSTMQSFGPVRQVEPKLVFEIGFEGIMPSSRHKSGVALRFPRMLRWRTDKPIEQADTLEQLKALL